MNSDEWTVILSSDDAKQLVLYNPTEHKLAVQSMQQHHLHSSSEVCALCRRPFDTSSSSSPAVSTQTQREYFRVLSKAYEAAHPEATPTRYAGIPQAVMNTGYYAQFFLEGRRLGRGAGGSVYACQHVLNGIVLGRYAVKKVPIGDNTDWLRRLLGEVHLLEATRHENVVEYKHAWLEEWQPSPFAPKVPFLFILMELAELGSLEDIMDDDGGEYNWIDLFQQIASGLGHLHERGIVHRDLKPSNILLSQRAYGRLRPMISDFGEAQGTGCAEAVDRTGTTGTIEYCAPELLRIDSEGKCIATHTTASDIWSLGMVFLHCLNNALPYCSDLNDYDVLRQEIIDTRQYLNTCA